MKRQGYPFAALCRMEKVKSAVMMALVNPNAGGLLVSGEKGSGKSTLGRAARELTDMPWVEVPVSVTEDRLFGSIDAEAAVRLGKRKLQPGLLDEADGGIMYIDDGGIAEAGTHEELMKKKGRYYKLYTAQKSFH